MIKIMSSYQTIVSMLAPGRVGRDIVLCSWARQWVLDTNDTCMWTLVGGHSYVDFTLILTIQPVDLLDKGSTEWVSDSQSYWNVGMLAL